jgi:hypothetical protein
VIAAGVIGLLALDVALALVPARRSRARG